MYVVTREGGRRFGKRRKGDRLVSDKPRSPDVNTTATPTTRCRGKPQSPSGPRGRRVTHTPSAGERHNRKTERRRGGNGRPTKIGHCATRVVGVANRKRREKDQSLIRPRMSGRRYRYRRADDATAKKTTSFASRCRPTDRDGSGEKRGAKFRRLSRNRSRRAADKSSGPMIIVSVGPSNSTTAANITIVYEHARRRVADIRCFSSII